MSEPTTDRSVRIERTFAAPVETIWQMWTVPEHFRSWYGPAGATIQVATFDVRVGGVRIVAMEVQTPSGTMQMWFAGEHLEVVENELLVYTEAVVDEHGSPVGGDRAGAPDVTEVRVELTRIDAGTRMVMTHLGIPPGSPGEAGWTMAFDKLGLAVSAGPAVPPGSTTVGVTLEHHEIIG